MRNKTNPSLTRPGTVTPTFARPSPIIMSGREEQRTTRRARRAYGGVLDGHASGIRWRAGKALMRSGEYIRAVEAQPGGPGSPAVSGI